MDEATGATGATDPVCQDRDMPADHPAVARALDAGGELDDGALLISRSVGSDGRSRAHLGGRGVPVAVLAELSESLVSSFSSGQWYSMMTAIWEPSSCKVTWESACCCSWWPCSLTALLSSRCPKTSFMISTRRIWP